MDKTVERDLCVVRELGLKLIYAMNTHVHADHVTGTGLIKVFLKSFVFDDDDAMWRYIVIDLGFFLFVAEQGSRGPIDHL